jgi:hypothetical protein
MLHAPPFDQERVLYGYLLAFLDIYYTMMLVMLYLVLYSTVVQNAEKTTNSINS